MAFSILDGAMAFGNGVMEADKKNTKENLLIRAEELKAKRDAVIAMKKSKYEYDLNNYDKNKTKYDGLTAVSTKLNTGGFNYKSGENEGKVDTFQLGLAFLEAKHGIDWVTKKKAQLIGAESDPTVWNAYVKNVGNNPDLKSSISNIDFKSRNTMESNYLNSLEAIESKYSAALKNAKNDSSLVNAILGKKKEEIANLTLDAADDKNTIKTIDSATVKTNNTDSAVEAITSESTDTTDKKELEFADSKDSVFIPKSYKDDYTKKIDDARKIDYSSKEYNNLFSGTVLTLIPNAKTEDYFEKSDKDGSLTAKSAIINADVTVQSLINGSLDDANVNDTFAITGNNKSAINFSANKIYQDAKNHVEEYGSWMAEGKVLSGGSLKNLFKKTTTALVVPSNSIINITDNKLKGFNITINKDLRKDVGKVYRNFIVTKAEERMQTQGGTLEENINILQRQLENDNKGNEQLTKDARTFIALSLKDVTNADGELIYPSLTAKKEKDSTGKADNTSTGKSTMEIKQEELSSGADKEDFNADGIRKITIKDKVTGEDTVVPLTTKNMNWLRKNYPEVNLAVDQDEMAGDGKIAETIAKETVKEKIKPLDIGIKNQPVFETLESIKAILPNEMTGQEIMDKYEIGFKINKFTKYSPSK
jgi:hypothetical protein